MAVLSGGRRRRERPGRHVEIVGHRDVHEAAHVAQGTGDMALAAGVLGEDEVARPADEARAIARLELEQPGSEEDELAPRRVVQVLHVALGRLAEEQRAALEGLRYRTRAGHGHLAHLDRGFARAFRVDPKETHCGWAASG